MHCDTQGSDLKVFQGLGNYKKILDSGVMECAVNKKRSLYQGNHTLEQTKKILFKKNISQEKALLHTCNSTGTIGIFVSIGAVNWKSIGSIPQQRSMFGTIQNI